MLVTWLKVSCIYHDLEKTWESYRPDLSVMTCHIEWHCVHYPSDKLAGDFTWLTASGQFWVSRQKPECLG